MRTPDERPRNTKLQQGAKKKINSKPGKKVQSLHIPLLRKFQENRIGFRVTFLPGLELFPFPLLAVANAICLSTAATEFVI